MKNKNKLVRPIHNFIFKIIRFLSVPVTYFLFGYKSKAKYKIAKDEQILILSNHQTDLDPFCIIRSFNKPIYCIATDTIFTGKVNGNFLKKYIGMIPKKKGKTDLRCAVTMNSVIKEGGSLLLFPEGNRTYAEFQFFISKSLIGLIRKFKVTLVIFNLIGGTGVRPRFSHKRRKGKFEGIIRKVIKYDEYKDMSDDDLYNLILENEKVFDSELGELYKSKRRAEYLEKMYFVCPKCNQANTLSSKGNELKCNSCGLTVTYNENLTMSSPDPSFTFDKAIKWWNYQKKWMRDLKIVEDEVIFSDDNLKFLKANPFEKKINLGKGVMKVTSKNLCLGDKVFDIKDIEICSVVSGKNLMITINNSTYKVRGHKRFNPVKYALLFNKIDTKMKLEKTDNYFNLEDN